MSKSKISILAVSFLLLALTIFLGYNFKDTQKDNVNSSSNTQQENTQNNQTTVQNQPNAKTSQEQPKNNFSYVDTLTKEVALTVNGEELSIEAFERRLHKTQFVFKAGGETFEKNKEKALKELEDTVISEFVIERVVMQLAQEFKIVASDEEVQQRLAATKQNFSEEQWQALLESRGINEEHLNIYNKIQLTEANLINWLGGEQQYTQYLEKKIAEAKVLINKPLMEELLSKL